MRISMSWWLVNKIASPWLLLSWSPWIVLLLLLWHPCSFYQPKLAHATTCRLSGFRCYNSSRLDGVGFDMVFAVSLLVIVLLWPQSRKGDGSYCIVHIEFRFFQGWRD
jgi:hypothetical protein